MSIIQIYREEAIANFIANLHRRRQQDTQEIESIVREIIADVRCRGDVALEEYAKKFDRVDLADVGIKVPIETIQKAHREMDLSFLEIIRRARANIERFHRQSLPQSWMTWEEGGVALGQRVLPLQRIGIYVPGGRAAYPSSLLMAAIPARVAGVKEIIITTPCDGKGEIQNSILATANELGITDIFRVGGAQAIAAMAYSTATIPRVDKIVGPGNAYVATAKRLLYGQTSIDMVAGPSEVLIVADHTAHPPFIAADLMAQAEHDPMASAILITDDDTLAERTATLLESQIKSLPRKEIIAAALHDFGGILITKDFDQSVDLANELAPEHLGLHLQDPWQHLHRFHNAGAIFLGSYSPEAVGDYWAGPNHILPTAGTARFFSPLRCEDFFKTSSVIAYSQAALQRDGSKIQQFAHMEGLAAHAMAIALRTKS